MGPRGPGSGRGSAGLEEGPRRRDHGGLSLSREAELCTAAGRNRAWDGEEAGADMMPVSGAARPLVHGQDVGSSEPT